MDTGLRKLDRQRFFQLLKPAALCFLSFFFERSLLKGRHFDDSFTGFRWALKSLWTRNILRLEKPFPWPVAIGVHIASPDLLSFDPNDLNNFQSFGIYIQNFGARVTIGSGTYIAPNVGIITANHSVSDLDQHVEAHEVTIGARCWIGMNSVILPGVTLGDETIVAAGAVVTKSYPRGHATLVGVPARPLPNPQE
ncbi:MAG: DapH/DapD/GlmU-related protein [Parvibaculaceae bacterium]|nr:DapH/DapD/GlmU-related protein [Parvibaculaceae bacterium]